MVSSLTLSFSSSPRRRLCVNTQTRSCNLRLPLSFFNNMCIGREEVNGKRGPFYGTQGLFFLCLFSITALAWGGKTLAGVLLNTNCEAEQFKLCKDRGRAYCTTFINSHVAESLCVDLETRLCWLHVNFVNPCTLVIFTWTNIFGIKGW